MDHDTAGVNFVCTFLLKVRITYCGNHTAKAFYNDLTKPKSVKCKVIHYRDYTVSRVYTHSVHHHVRHGSDDFIKWVKSHYLRSWPVLMLLKQKIPFKPSRKLY